jgi:hypothetical protein
MPIFKSTYNILTRPDEDELFNPNWMNSDKLLLPPKKDWDYSRDLTIEDVNIWEVIYQQGGGKGLYASWDPYAEFYMITFDNWVGTGFSIETFYGSNAGMNAFKRSKELGFNISLNKVWVEPDQMWLHSLQNEKTPTIK